MESAREVAIEVDEVNPDLMKKLEAALAGDGGVLWLTDRKGRQTGVNPARIAYIEIDPTISTSGAGFAP